MNDKTAIGSGLFYWNTDLSSEKCLEILSWYNSLTDKEKKYIDILRSEASDDARFED